MGVSESEFPAKTGPDRTFRQKTKIDKPWVLQSKNTNRTLQLKPGSLGSASHFAAAIGQTRNSDKSYPNQNFRTKARFSGRTIQTEPSGGDRIWGAWNQIFWPEPTEPGVSDKTPHSRTWGPNTGCSGQTRPKSDFPTKIKPGFSSTIDSTRSFQPKIEQRQPSPPPLTQRGIFDRDPSPQTFLPYPS